MSRLPLRLGTYFLVCLVCSVALAARPTPLTFGVVADVQYADRNDSGARHYRDSLAKLDACVADLNTRGVAFTVELGDLVDGGGTNLTRAVAAYDKLTVPRYYVLGNHDCLVGRAALLPKLGLAASYYSFRQDGWRFLVLDTSEISPDSGWPAGSPQARLGEVWLARMKAERRPYAEPWNGAISNQQLRWLWRQLDEATAAGERVIVLGHIPVIASPDAAWALLYNHDEVARALEAHSCVAAYICGHEHSGGYAFHNGVHYLILQGMVESPDTAYAVLTLTPDHIEVRGLGTVPSCTLSLLRPAPAE